jgi:hypothetical protein
VFLRAQSRAVIAPGGPAMVSSLLIPGFGAPLRRRHFCISAKLQVSPAAEGGVSVSIVDSTAAEPTGGGG